MLRLKYEPNNFYHRYTCALCNGLTDKSDWWVYLVDSETGNRVAEPICERCIEAGPAGTVERMFTTAAELRAQAAYLETNATRVGYVRPEDWLTLKELQDDSRARWVAGGGELPDPLIRWQRDADEIPF